MHIMCFNLRRKFIKKIRFSLNLVNYLDKIYKDKCPDKTASWYSARDNCHHQGLQLRSYTSSSFSSDCAPSNQTYWIGNHVAEKIIWANGKWFLCFYVESQAHNLVIIYITNLEQNQLLMSPRFWWDSCCS